MSTPRRRLPRATQTAGDCALLRRLRRRHDLAVELWPYEPLTARVWELRRNLTCYDAAYGALAETIDVPC